jgi:PhnB protein
MDARILPQLSVRRGRAAVEFYRDAFGATEVYRVGGTDDNPELVSQLAIGEASFWVSDEHGWRLGRVLDPFGHHWEIGNPLGPWPPEH